MRAEGASILVVDDDVDTCRNLSDILTDMGYHVDTAHDGPTALGLARRRRYDVALLDFKMPGMDGLTLYRELRKLRAETVAIVVSAFAAKSTTAEALSAGAWQVLPKPIDFPRKKQTTNFGMMAERAETVNGNTKRKLHGCRRKRCTSCRILREC